MNYSARQLGDQAPELLKRIEAARENHASLKSLIETERPLRSAR